MQQEVVCQICHQILAVPFTFQCCYTSVCQACLKQTSYKEPKTSEKSHSFCPFCYKEINDLSLPFMNKFLGEYIEAIKLEKENNCDCCEKSIKYNDTIICSDCGNKVFCSDCCTILHSVGKYQLHERSCFLSSVNCQATSFTKGVTCYSHIKEKIEFICLKDFDVLCSKCCIGHKKNCKASLIVPLREAYKELQEQITNKKDKLIHQQAMITKECENMERKLHILDINYNNNKEDIEEQFRSLREILNYKEKELLTTLENYWNKQRTLLKKEIQSIKENSGAIESLKDIISFSLSYQNLNFLESIKYLFYKIEHIMSNSKPKKDGFESSMTLHIPNLEDCKTFLYNLSFNEINESSVLPNNRPGSRRSYSIVMTEPSQNRTLTPVLKLAFPRNEFSKTDLELTERDTSRLDTSVEKAQGDLIFGEKETSCSAKTLSASSLHKSGFGRSSNLNKSFSLKSGERIAVPRTSLKIENRDIFDFDLSKVTGSSPIKSSRINTSYLEKDIAKTPQTKESDTPKRGFEFLSNRALSLSLKGQNSILKYDVKYFTELQKNPLLKRNFTETAQTSNSIFVAWTHVFEQINILYQVEYGVGTKVKGVEQFRTAFKGYGHTCIIADLMPRTSYRIRVRPILSKEGDETPLSNREKEGRAGEWSNTVNVYTRDSQKIDYSSMGLHAKMVIKGKETYVEFNKSGIITANDHYAYGKTAWEVELKQQSAHQTTDDSSSYIKVGVTNKVGKTINIFGSLINYGLQKESTKILVVLDLENRCLTVYSPTDPNGETINNLPEGPLYPAFQNKTNKNSNFVFRLYIKFDLPSDQVGKVMP